MEEAFSVADGGLGEGMSWVEVSELISGLLVDHPVNVSGR